MSIELNSTFLDRLIDGMERIAKGKPQDCATSSALQRAWKAMKEGQSFICAKDLTKREVDAFYRMTQRVIYIFSGSSKDQPVVQLALALRFGVLQTAPTFKPKGKKQRRSWLPSTDQPSSGKFPRRVVEEVSAPNKGSEPSIFTRLGRVWTKFTSLFEARSSEREWGEVFKGYIDSEN